MGVKQEFMRRTACQVSRGKGNAGFGKGFQGGYRCRDYSLQRFVAIQYTIYLDIVIQAVFAKVSDR